MTTKQSLFLGTSATAYGQNIAFHKDAFAFVTADLEVPNGVDMAAREVYDGVSMRFVRWFDGDAGEFKSRIDILYGLRACLSRISSSRRSSISLTSVAQDELFSIGGLWSRPI